MATFVMKVPDGAQVRAFEDERRLGEKLEHQQFRPAGATTRAAGPGGQSVERPFRAAVDSVDDGPTGVP
jgi:hypothetical protein